MVAQTTEQKQPNDGRRAAAADAVDQGHGYLDDDGAITGYRCGLDARTSLMDSRRFCFFLCRVFLFSVERGHGKSRFKLTYREEAEDISVPPLVAVMCK